MNREIKFRVWDKKNKEWASHQADFEIDGVLSTPEEDRYIVMQYTGLKDSKGVEIFEGDILQDGRIVTAIEWDRANARFYTHPGTERAWPNCTVIGNIHQNRKLLR